MNHHWSKVLIALLLLALTLTVLPAALAQRAEGTDKIEQALLDRFATEGSADFIVRFADQADLSPAYKMNWQERGEFVVRVLTETAQRSQARARALLDARGLRYRTFIAGNELYVWSGNLQTAKALANLPEVAFIRAPRTYHIDPVISSEPKASPQALDWGIVDTGADDFWATFGMQGQGIVVSNIDTGVQWDHPALDQAYRCPANPTDPSCWYDPSNICGGTVCDNNGHGTHTMGTMVGDDDPSLPYQVGMAPDAQFIMCKGCETNSCSEFALNACADWMLAPGGNPNNRPHVVNNSWGGGGCDDWYLVKVNAWRAAGIFPAFSAGNSGSGCNTLGSPGDYQESFGSAAHDSSRTIAAFSSRGPSCFGHDPYTKPNISAPGVNVCSSIPTNSWSCAYSGTSMASPHSAGAVALLWSCNPSLIGQIDQTFEILQDNADTPPPGNCGAPPDGEGNYTYGYGYLNVYNAGLLWCGDTGHLDGHVRDATTSNPIANALVEATEAGGIHFYDYTDGSGYYTMTVLVGTYQMTATAYGYLPGTAGGVVVVTDTVTTQDFDLQPAPTYVVSGTVTEVGSGTPLYAQVSVLGTPLPPVWTDPNTGYYSITVAEGTYTFRVTAAQHRPTERVVVVDHDQTQNFSLEPLPCILLVDDDQNGPDVLSYYTSALDTLPYGYDVWDVVAQGDPSAADLLGYRIVIWFTGYPWSGTFTAQNETDVAAYLDAGGHFFLSSEDYLFEFGLTPFGQNYLGITTYTDDMMETDVIGNAGNPIGDGLGPYNLVAPSGWTGALWTDYVSGAQSPFRYQASGQNNSTNYEGTNFKTVFFGWPLEGISNVSDRADVLSAIIDWFGGCGPKGHLAGYVYDAFTNAPIAGATVTAGVVQATTDPTGYYTMTLLAGFYDVTASHPHYETQVITGVEVVSNTITPLDFYLTPRGRLWGYVTDYDNGFPLEGATVTASDGTSDKTDATGYYEMYLDDGTYVVTATMKDYAPATATVAIVSGEEVRQDFALLAAVSFIPSPLHVTVPWQDTYNTSVTVTNRMTVPYPFEFQEVPGGFIPALAAQEEVVPAPTIPVPVFTGVAPEGYVPQPAPLPTGLEGLVWEARAPSPFASMDNVFIEYNGMGYLIGGYGAPEQVAIYDPTTDSWTLGASGPAPQIEYIVDGCFGFNENGDPVIVLFNDTTSGVTTLHRYNIATNSWDTPPVPV
ncbi:MAG: carboxypeptidase regulatory-like domain-containing protein, partial [Chloroflexia bacterium]